MPFVFNTEGPVMRALSDLLTLLKLNLLTILCCLPIVTAGAALTALHRGVMRIIDGEDGNVARDYFRDFRDNLKSMTPIWLILAFLGGFLYLDTIIFPAQGEGGFRLMLVPVYLGIFVLHGFCQWVFPLGARFENSLGAKFRNAFRFMIGAFPRTLGMMAISAVIPFVLTQSMRLLPLAFVFGLSLPAYLCAFLYYPVIEKQIKAMTGEEEPSDDALSEAISEEKSE